MTTLTGVHHLALTVADADKSAAFYSELLGLDEAFQIDDDTVYARVFAGDGFLFGVRHYKNHAKDRFSEFRSGMDHFAFGVTDRDRWQASNASSQRWERSTPPHARHPSGPWWCSATPTAYKESSSSPQGDRPSPSAGSTRSSIPDRTGTTTRGGNASH